MTTKEKDIIDKIKNAIIKKDPMADIILFGSHAKGTATPDSDWDILILLNQLNVSRKTEQEFRYSLIDVEIEIGEVISTFVYSKSDWENKFHLSSLYESVNKEGIHLNEGK